jgi:hypothetical protein
MANAVADTLRGEFEPDVSIAVQATEAREDTKR